MSRLAIPMSALVAAIIMGFAGGGLIADLGTAVFVLAVFSLLGLARTQPTEGLATHASDGQWAVIALSVPPSPIELVKAVRERVDTAAAPLLRALKSPPAEVARFRDRNDAEVLASVIREHQVDATIRRVDASDGAAND